MDQKLESTFLTALEQNQQRLLRVCSVYAERLAKIDELIHVIEQA